MDSTCDCTAISSNGNVCLKYTCVTQKREPTCFPSRSTIVTENGVKKSLSYIDIGERVLVINKENKLIYEPIEDFIHLKRNANDTELNNVIFASRLHSDDHIKYVYKNEIILDKIRNIDLTTEEGYYAPLTPSGTIIIDNVLVSNFASVNNHYLAHNVMKIY
ncbi:unnamed protein product [Rotaria sp. Silwood1]|nr:unnamed protein product [Rotaria sp. Silwood1]CAF1381852.1 unnamed protein product [Rotaria sp. Silwood1]CAF1384989.1 unnamed protein product [Rotaria sp. Silwood1]CAF4579677.1 unnamed protein product [Rotaria sp. Silwood1]